MLSVEKDLWTLGPNKKPVTTEAETGMVQLPANDGHTLPLQSLKQEKMKGESYYRGDPVDIWIQTLNLRSHNAVFQHLGNHCVLFQVKKPFALILSGLFTSVVQITMWPHAVLYRNNKTYELKLP